MSRSADKANGHKLISVELLVQEGTCFSMILISKVRLIGLWRPLSTTPTIPSGKYSHPPEMYLVLSESAYQQILKIVTYQRLQLASRHTYRYQRWRLVKWRLLPITRWHNWQLCRTVWKKDSAGRKVYEKMRLISCTSESFDMTRK